MPAEEATDSLLFISSDIAVEKPDKKLLIMYLTSMYDNLEGRTAVKRKESIQVRVLFDHVIQ